MSSPESASTVNVLVVTADPEFANAAEQWLPAEGDIAVSSVSTVSAAVDRLEEEPRIDCVVSDHDLPETDGIALLETVRVETPSLPFILFTTEGNERVASRAITGGVTDYLIKERYADQWDRLATLVTDATSYYRTQRDLVDPETRAKTLLDNTHDTLFVARDGVCEYVNRTGVELLNADGRSEVIGRRMSEFFDADAAALEAQLDAVQSGEESVREREHRLIRTIGTGVPVTVTTVRIVWSGKPAVFLVVRDVSGKDELVRNLELKDRTINEAPIGVTISDPSKPDNPLIYVNEKFLELTGHSESEVVGRNCRFLQGEGTDPEPVSDMREAIEKEEPVTVELRNYRKDGTEFWNRVTVAPLTDDEGEVTHYVGFQEDVTERKEGERSLRQYRQSVESSKDLLAAVDGDLDYLFANREYREYHGIESLEVTDVSLPAVIGREQFDAIEPDVRAALRGRVVRTEITREHPEKGDRLLDVRLFPLERSDGSVRGVGASMRDITEDRERKREIERESELRRIMSDINQKLVRAKATDELAPEITDIIGASPRYACTFMYLLDAPKGEVVCRKGSELTEAEVESLHTDDYLEAVFDEGVLRMDDVTAPPFAHHDPEEPSHSGVACAISHDDGRYGILTVHFPPGEPPTADDIE
ncbi:MAG: PAS domain S-box protein, partial [Haloferacaceae archaeon]